MRFWMARAVLLTVCSLGPFTGLVAAGGNASWTRMNGDSTLCPGSVTDVEGHRYPTVFIGRSCWMARNLSTRRFANGDSIPIVVEDGAWNRQTEGACSPYATDTSHSALYGLLYNGHAVLDPRGICPNGWHVATDRDWMELTDALGGPAVAGGSLKATGQRDLGTGLWDAPNLGAQGQTGFDGLPGGVRNFDGQFEKRGQAGYWWTASPSGERNAWRYRMRAADARLDRVTTDKVYGMSVRCVKD